MMKLLTLTGLFLALVGCNRNTEFIILKQPHTEAYSMALEEAMGERE